MPPIDDRTTNKSYAKPNALNNLSDDVTRISNALDDIDADIFALESVGPGATDLSYNASTRVIASSTGTDATLPLVDGANAGLMDSLQAIKLNEIEPLADRTTQARVLTALDGATLDNVTINDALVTSAVLTDGATPAIDALIAPLRTWTLGANGRTPSISWGSATAARSITLLITGNGFDTISWSTIAPTWVGAPPTISSTGVTAVTFLRVDGVTYGFGPAPAGTTDLSYTASTRILASSSGADATLPLADGTNPGLMAAADFTKLGGIGSGAEANVNADWNAVSGDAQILNKPTLGTAASAATTDFAPAAQGVTNGNSHDHNGGDGAQIAYSSLSGLPTLGSLAALSAIGSITSAGAIGSTATLPIITTTGGVLTTGTFGTTAGSFCQGNDSRLSDARTPTAHNQAWSSITSTPTTLAGYGISNAVTSGGALGTPASGTLTNCSGLPVSGIVASTTLSLGVGTIELGAASDTTIGRVSAGVIAVEGVSLGRVIGSGTAALGTSAISSGASATVVTVAATGVATTDVIDWGFNTNPNAVTGYSAASTTGCLVITAYPTAGNVNFVVSNPTAGSITPGALTLNWKVTR